MIGWLTYLIRKFGHPPDWLLGVAIFFVALIVFLKSTLSKNATTPQAEPHDDKPEGHLLPIPRVTSEDAGKLTADSAALNREIASLNEKLNDSEQKRQMPRPYLEVLDSAESMFGKTPFVLTNRGGDVAHNVQVQPLSVNHRTVTFDPIPTIAVDEQKQTLPTVVGIGAMQEHDILSLMEDECNAAFSGRGLAGLDVHEWPTKVTITYQDFTGKQFETTLDLIVFPIAKILSDKHGDSWPKYEYKTVEIRNIKFMPVQ